MADEDIELDLQNLSLKIFNKASKCRELLGTSRPNDKKIELLEQMKDIVLILRDKQVQLKNLGGL